MLLTNYNYNYNYGDIITVLHIIFSLPLK